MADSVKFIFKTLLKVPCFIAIAYIIANLFAFSLFYFKFLGVSYAVMQTVLENNYIPETEMKGLKESMETVVNPNHEAGFHNSLISDMSIYIDDNTRVQYGHIKEAGVIYKYKWVFPLMPEEYGQGAVDADTVDYAGLAQESQDDGDVLYGNIGGEEDPISLQTARDAKASTGTIKILYKVPGLQYYADLP